MTEFFGQMGAWFSQTCVGLREFGEFFWNVSQSISGGLNVTLGLFFGTIILSIPIGLLLSIGAAADTRPVGGIMSPGKWIMRALQAVIKFYIWVLRGTPLLLQLLFIYYGLATMFHIVIDNFTAAIVAFALNYAAYFAEIFRAGIQSVDRGQYEAARALGLSSSAMMFRVVIPQMIRTVLPPVGNEAITLVKDTSLVSIIALSDILNRTQNIVMREADVAPFIVAAVFYLVMTFILTKLFAYLEKRASVSDMRAV